MEFTPNITPHEMFKLGVFGGTYYRNIQSSITNKKYTGQQYKEFQNNILRGIDKSMYSYDKCDKTKNYYNIVSGSSLDMWETKGWIVAQDPYGWVQWWCRYSLGRRTPDDARQIKRWNGVAGPNGRFKKMLKRYPKSKKIKQLLLQWGVFVDKI